MWAVVGVELGEWGWRYSGVDTACLRALLEAGRARQEEGGGGIGRLWRARRSEVIGRDGAGCDGGGDVERGDELGGGGTSPTAARGHEVGLKFGSARAATAWAAWRAAAGWAGAGRLQRRRAARDWAVWLSTCGGDAGDVASGCRLSGLSARSSIQIVSLDVLSGPCPDCRTLHTYTHLHTYPHTHIYTHTHPHIHTRTWGEGGRSHTFGDWRVRRLVTSASATGGEGLTRGVCSQWRKQRYE